MFHFHRHTLICAACFLVACGVSAATRDLVPNSDGEGGLGVTNKQWDTLYVGGVVVGSDRSRHTSLAPNSLGSGVLVLGGTGVSVRAATTNAGAITWTVDNTRVGTELVPGQVSTISAASNTTYYALTTTNTVDQYGETPDRCTQLAVKAWGAGGGASYNRTGGAGGFSYSGPVAVSSRVPYYVRVGMRGNYAATNYSSRSGGGFYFRYSGAYHGAGGGGYSAFLWSTNFVSTDSAAITNFLVIAGGGGGGGMPASGSGVGGLGGGLVGGSGGAAVGGAPAATGGSQTSGGVTYGVTSAPASFLVGQGGGEAVLNGGNYWANGSGGGGYFGGAAGSVSNNPTAGQGGASGGAGGSGYGLYTVSGNNSSDPDWVSNVGGGAAVSGTGGAGGDGRVIVFFWLAPP